MGKNAKSVGTLMYISIVILVYYHKTNGRDCHSVEELLKMIFYGT